MILPGLTVFSRELSIIPTLGSLPIRLNEPIIYNDDTVTITDIKLYICLSAEDESECHLLDMQDSLHIRIPDSSSRCIFGIDSSRTMRTDFSNALDPIHGMFWTWQSGYINIKVEGISRKSPQRNNVFQLHLGGFQAPYQTAFSIEITKSDQSIIMMDLAPSINAVLTSHNGTVMSPGKHAQHITQLLQQSIRIVE